MAQWWCDRHRLRYAHVRLSQAVPDLGHRPVLIGSQKNMWHGHAFDIELAWLRCAPSAVQK